MTLALRDACSPAEAEVALEACARGLRRRWLDAASSATNGSYRSPLAAQTTRTATGPSMNFGYERELRPIDLENRCRAFFGPIPHSWSEDYAVFSSGQAAMAAVLHLLDTFEFLGAKRPLSQRIVVLTSKRQKFFLFFHPCSTFLRKDVTLSTAYGPSRQTFY